MRKSDTLIVSCGLFKYFSDFPTFLLGTFELWCLGGAYARYYLKLFLHFRSQESEVWFSAFCTFCVLFWFWFPCHHLKPCAALGFRGLKTYYSYKLLIKVVFLKGKFIFPEEWIYKPSYFKRWVCNRNKEEYQVPEAGWSFSVLMLACCFCFCASFKKKLNRFLFFTFYGVLI